MGSLLKHRFTKENAREMHARATAVRMANKGARVEAIANPAKEAIEDARFVLQRIARVRAQLCRLDVMIDLAKTPQQWDSLTRAYERLFKVWAWLTQTPGPGQYKPGPSQRSRRTLHVAPMPLPIDVEAQASEQGEPLSIPTTEQLAEQPSPAAAQPQPEPSATPEPPNNAQPFGPSSTEQPPIAPSPIGAS